MCQEVHLDHFNMPPTVPTAASPLPRTPGSSFPQPHVVLLLITSILEKAFSKQPNKHFHHFCTTYRFVPGDLLEDNLVWCRLTGCHLICPWQLLPLWEVRQVLGLGTGETILNIKSRTFWAQHLLMRCCTPARDFLLPASLPMFD